MSAQCDIPFYSQAFNTERWYRIYLPTDYNENLTKRYPVVYYFHGWGGRYKWDNYNVTDDPFFPGNGRKEPPFVMEWRDYSDSHDVIIVTWDGYEPNLHEGKNSREGIKYGGCSPYDYVRAHEKEDHHWGWDYRLYFRDLVKHVDENFRTIADRDHRAITGLSMGGLTSLYIAGQNKDLVSSVSAFDPADNIPLYGPKGRQAVFPVLEMYRSLKGLPVRLTATDGDWLKYNNREMSRIFEAADLTHFEFHIADFPDHWAADTDKQLDFHMNEFRQPHPLPDNWNHICPAFPSFKVWGYDISVQRSQPALTILENVTPGHMKILARTFIPDGPIVQHEKISISTIDIYSPTESYQLISYNLISGETSSRNLNASENGKLKFELGGGGHIVGINGKGTGNGAKLRMVHKQNKEYHYFEVGKTCNLDFKLVNVGGDKAEDIQIIAFSPHPNIDFADSIIHISCVSAASSVDLDDQFDFSFSQYSDSSFVGEMFFEVRISGVLEDTHRMMFFPVPESPYISDKDVIILDGRTVNNIPVYMQGLDSIVNEKITGGVGNGDGILDRGEDALIYIRLPRGMAANDINTFHRTYLINHRDNPFTHVNRLYYEEKFNQAGATSISTFLSIAKDTPDGHEFDFWFKVESLYNDKNDITSRAAIYAHQYDYCKISLIMGNRD